MSRAYFLVEKLKVDWDDTKDQEIEKKLREGETMSSLH